MATLYFEIMNSQQLSMSDRRTIHDISTAFNQGLFRGVWTCDNFFLTPLAASPNWEHPDHQNENAQEVSEQIQERFEELESRGKHYVDIALCMEKEGVVIIDSEERIRGSCNVQDNEENALLVYAALLLISSNTRAFISLIGGDGFLFCPVLIRSGLAMPWSNSIRSIWDSWREAGWTENSCDSRTETYKIQRDLVRRFRDFTAPGRFCRPLSLLGYESLERLIEGVAEDNGWQVTS